MQDVTATLWEISDRVKETLLGPLLLLFVLACLLPRLSVSHFQTVCSGLLRHWHNFKITTMDLHQQSDKLRTSLLIGIVKN